jgi:SAM-dependent methyltransferase
MFEVVLPPSAIEVVLRDPVSGEVAGRWSFGPGDGPLRVDFLDPRLCRVERREVRESWVAEGFVAYPRLTFEVDGRRVELVCSDPEVLRRHYSRPTHQARMYNPTPDPWVDAFHRARLRQVRRLLSGVRGRVADVGSGYSLVAMAGPWPFRLYGCDRDLDAARTMSQRDGASCVVAAAEAVPFRAGTFDAVFAGEIIEHLPHRQDALAAWVSLLRPGGRLVLTTPNRRHLLTRARGYEAVQNPEHLYEYTPAELHREIEASGARVERMEGLALPFPVWIPGRGWRDLSHVLPHRLRQFPTILLRGMVAAGRPLPSLSEDFAVVARRL